ncbi:two-component regulator propeller domain-containing protein [Parachryseolinea silvisoli]|uniref:two-component regulator propeller domain-containing protein n=1 Tax=Parachryseolinea silvisoli TaxID=2873601 RepID=UPI002265EB8C|nr:two-component regulator propeller domain-containing protein [Parachryseolinea silvisoli]MCD9015045.1 response regulator [Parachryseolinea silvisoli]
MLCYRKPISRLLALFYLLLPAWGWAQQSYHFRHIGRSEGLSQSNVTCILQDHKGFMWFGTRDGLNHYDGHTITVYRHDPANPRSLSHNYIRALYEDNQHRLWIGTDEGLNLYNRTTDDFTRFLPDPQNPAGISSSNIRAITQDRHQRLWIGTGGGGLNRFDPEQNTFYTYRHDPRNGRSISSDQIEDILEDPGGSLWVATWNAGLNKLDPATGIFERYVHILTSDKLKKLYLDRRQDLWIGTTEGGLNRYDRRTNTFVAIRATTSTAGLNNNDVLSIVEDTRGNLWVGTQNGGINILDTNRHNLHYIHEGPNPEDLNNGSIYTLYRDRQGDIWVGTFSGGVNYYNSTPPRFHHLPAGNILSVYEDPRETLYLGTDGDGLTVYDRHQQVTHLRHRPDDKQSIGSNYPLCLFEDHAGQLWAGCFYGKASVLRTDSRTFYTPPFTVDVKHVAVIGEDAITGKIWMGTWGEGLVVYDPRINAWKQYLPEAGNDKSISHTLIFAIYQDRRGDLWIGTEGGGLNRYNRVTDDFTHFADSRPHHGSMGNNIVNVIYEDARGNLWVGTQGGLNRLDRDTGQFENYTTRDGLANDVVQSIEEDHHGRLWLGTNKGISRFDPDTKTFRNYEIAEGTQHNAFNRQSSWKNPAGRLYFGGINGLSYFHPDSLTDSPVHPPVYFTELQVFNKPVSFREKDAPLAQPLPEAQVVTLSYDQSVFSFEFVALDYTAPGKNQYAYTLEGFDKVWNETGTQRKATYTNLDPGEYTLHIKATNSDGVWNTEGSSLRIIITPPFWQTWWARAVYVLLLAGAIFALRLIVIQRLRVRNQLEMDQIKLRFYANISHEFRTPLTLMLGPLSQVMASTEEGSRNHQMLQLVQKNSQRLLKLINQLMHIYKLDAGFMKLAVTKGDLGAFVRSLCETFQFDSEKRNIQFTVTAPAHEEYYFDADKLEKILLNVLSNAFKHTPDQGHITLTLRLHDTDPRGTRKRQSYAHIAITNSGRAIPESYREKIFDPFFRIEHDEHSTPGTGLGLSLARQLARLHKGDIVLANTGDNCTTFAVWLPVDAAAFDRHEYAPQDRLVEPSEATITPEGLLTAIPGAPAGTLPVLLVVEDNPDIRRFIRLHFENAFQVEEAHHGEEGLVQARNLLPDIILTDVMMPVMDGVTLCTRIKHDILTSHIPVVLLTARGDEALQLRAFREALADDYIVKPFQPHVLLAKLVNILTLRENQKRRYYRDFITNPTAPATLDDDFLQRAVAVVERHIDNPDFDIEKFCRELALSQTNLYRKLQSLLGVSGNQFIRDIRMKRAVQLLATEQYAVHEVATQVGFADAKYFSKAFKKQFGVLPSAYRNIGQSVPTSLEMQ